MIYFLFYYYLHQLSIIMYPVSIDDFETMILRLYSSGFSSIKIDMYFQNTYKFILLIKTINSIPNAWNYLSTIPDYDTSLLIRHRDLYWDIVHTFNQQHNHIHYTLYELTASTEKLLWCAEYLVKHGLDKLEHLIISYCK